MVRSVPGKELRASARGPIVPRLEHGESAPVFFNSRTSTSEPGDHDLAGTAGTPRPRIRPGRTRSTGESQSRYQRDWVAQYSAAPRMAYVPDDPRGELLSREVSVSESRRTGHGALYRFQGRGGEG